MIPGLIGTLIGKSKYSQLMKACEVESGDDTFSYQGKLYDRKKYIRLRREGLEDLSKKGLRSMYNDLLKIQAKGKMNEVDKIELEIVDSMLTEAGWHKKA